MQQTAKVLKFKHVALLILLAGLATTCGPGTSKGDKLAEAGDLEGAVEVYRAVYDKKPQNKVALIKLGRTLFQLNSSKKDGGKKVSGEEWSETYTLLERGRTVEPVPPEVDPIKDFELSDSAFEAGKALAAEGKHRNAVKLFMKAQEAGKSGAKLFEEMARSQIEAKDTVGAVDSILEAIKNNTMDGKLSREGALLALDKGRLADCHEMMLVGEALAPAGFKYFGFKDIQLMCSRSYFFLTTGLLETVFTTPRMDSARVKTWKADEELMTKNWDKFQKRRPEEILKEDKDYFLRILFHLYITHGMAHMLLCEFDQAKQWWENADLIDKAKIKAPSNVDEETLADELTWPQNNIKMLDGIAK